jgi:hypothetical protein
VSLVYMVPIPKLPELPDVLTQHATLAVVALLSTKPGKACPQSITEQLAV